MFNALIHLDVEIPVQDPFTGEEGIIECTYSMDAYEEVRVSFYTLPDFIIHMDDETLLETYHDSYYRIVRNWY